MIWADSPSFQNSSNVLDSPDLTDDQFLCRQCIHGLQSITVDVLDGQVMN